MSRKLNRFVFIDSDAKSKTIDYTKLKEKECFKSLSEILKTNKITHSLDSQSKSTIILKILEKEKQISPFSYIQKVIKSKFSNIKLQLNRSSKSWEENNDNWVDGFYYTINISQGINDFDKKNQQNWEFIIDSLKTLIFKEELDNYTDFIIFENKEEFTLIKKLYKRFIYDSTSAMIECNFGFLWDILKIFDNEKRISELKDILEHSETLIYEFNLTLHNDQHYSESDGKSEEKVDYVCEFMIPQKLDEILPNHPPFIESTFGIDNLEEFKKDLKKMTCLEDGIEMGYDHFESMKNWDSAQYIFEGLEEDEIVNCMGMVDIFCKNSEKIKFPIYEYEFKKLKEKFPSSSEYRIENAIGLNGKVLELEPLLERYLNDGINKDLETFMEELKYDLKWDNFNRSPKCETPKVITPKGDVYVGKKKLIKIIPEYYIKYVVFGWNYSHLKNRTNSTSDLVNDSKNSGL